MRRFERPVIDLDGPWRFVPDAEQTFEVDRLPLGQPIAVPGCWEAQVERPYQIITAWYSRTFDVPVEWTGRQALVRFGAVMYHCRVWLNGQLVGQHEGGYTEFTLPLVEAIRPGPNELRVRVTNPLNGISDYPALPVERALLAEEWAPDLPLTQAPHGKQTWYSSQSGIWRSVSVEQTADVWVDSVRVLPDVAGGQARVLWSLAGQTPDDEPALRVMTRLEPPAGGPAVEETHTLTDRGAAGEFVISVPEPVLWDTHDPALYRLRATLVRGAETVDSVTVRFGMRTIEISQGCILLNGSPIFLRGALDQDLYPDTISGTPSRDFLVRQFRLARDMGLNLLRCHIKSPDPVYAEVADECGLLLWCELPNWTVFSDAAAIRGTETLRDMVVALGNHPSIVAWTIINEDWGTDLRHEARDRLWLRHMVAWLRDLDPSRVVIDNSACETPETPNFHVETDLLDFHLYFASPDNAHRWSASIAEFARRPAYLWSPHGDAVERGDEALVLSEFGSWGLPDPATLVSPDGHPPWWFSTGHGFYRPAGIWRRFTRYGLDRIWADVSSLATATQWHQFENFQYEVAELRRHASIAGYVVTEFTDATWEANGLLDIRRGPKAFHDRLGQVNAPDVAVTTIARRDVVGGATIEVPFWVSAYGRPSVGGSIEWSLRLADGLQREGVLRIPSWPDHTSTFAGSAIIPVPDVSETTDARLSWVLQDASEDARSSDSVRLAVLPSARSGRPVSVAVHDPLGIWQIRERIEVLGHRLTDLDDADVLVAANLDERIVDHADAGGQVLVLVRTETAVPPSVDLARHVSVQLRRLPAAGWPGQRSPWDGDWVTSFSWMLPDLQAGLPQRAPLDFAYTEVLPDHVLLGYEPSRHNQEVSAGMFVGWVHAPAALEWRFAQGAGSITLTTFRLAPESGPVATALLDRLIHRAAAGGRS